MDIIYANKNLLTPFYSDIVFVVVRFINKKTFRLGKVFADKSFGF